MDVAVFASSALALLLYWNTLDADFAYDDSRAIKTNLDLLPSTPVSSLFFNDFWGTPLTHSGSHKSYRPLCVLSFRLNYRFGELDAFGYHLVNVALHALVTGLFTRLARSLFRAGLPACVAGVLFAAHPVHTEAVAGVVGRADVGACLFFLLALLSYRQYCRWREAGRRGRWLHLGGAVCWSTCSMLTKEHGITVLAVCATYDVLVHSRVRPRDLGYILFEKKYRGLCEGLAALGGSIAILVSLRVHFMGNKPPDFAPADNPASDSDSYVTRGLTFLFLPAFNFWLLLCPRWLSFDWSMEAIPLLTSCFDPRNALSLAFYFGLGRLALFALRAANGRDPAPLHRTNNNGCASGMANGGVGGCGGGNGNGGVGSNGNVPSATALAPATGVTSVNHNYYKTVPSGGGTSAKRKNQQQKVANGFSNHGGGAGVHNGGGVLVSGGGNGNASHAAATATCMAACGEQLDALLMALALLVLPFLPATNLFFYVGFVVAERVLYVASMGFCLLVALGVHVLHRWTRRRRLLVAVLAFLFLVLGVRTVRRNVDWKTEENLYRSGISINPPKAYGNLANILSAQGKKEEAEWAYKKALSYRSNMADVHYNLGILLQEQKRYDEALQSYRLAIQFRPRMAMAHLNLGLVLGILGRKEEASEVYRHCSQLDGTGLKDPRTHETTKISALFNLGRLYADDGKFEEAISVYKEAVRKMPSFYQPQSLYNMLGEAYFKLEQFEEAEYWYKEALRAKPDHIPAHLTYGKMLAKLQNRVGEAEQWFTRAKLLAPNDSSVYQHYGQFLSEVERHSEAAEHYVRAAELAPDEYEIVFNAANTLRQAGQNEEAEKYYRQAVKLRPEEATSHMNLGAMLHVNGKLLEAELSYLEALRLRPEDAITQNNLQKLRNLLVKKGLRNAPADAKR